MPGTCADPDATPALRLVTVANASRPIHLVGHPSEPDVMLIAERGGAVRQLRITPGNNMGTLSGPIVNVQTKQDGERGLLSIALHPDDPSRLFAFFIASNNDSVVQEFKRNPEGGMATPVGQPRYRAAHSANNHQGGNIAFGPDKMLYFAIGDNAGEVPGGRDRSLDLNTEFGKLLRIDPTTGNAAPGNTRGRIFASGLRNPWRMSFDRRTGDLYIGDVGFQTEEINFLPPNRAGVNFGWSGGGNGMGAAALSYGRACVIGGYVYRGTKMPCMQGRYIWKDRLSGPGRSFVIQNGRATNQKNHSGLNGGGLYSFGEDGAGELYMLFENGRVARIAE
jgi:glucose/arabinose dehydrogenase